MAIEVTDAMVEAARTALDDRKGLRSALTVALALVPDRFRAGMERAAQIIKQGQQTFSTYGGNSTRSLSPRVDGNMDGLAYAAAILAELDPPLCDDAGDGK